MAFKIGRLEIGYRLLISLTAIAIAYGYLGSYLCTVLRYDNYLIAVLLFALAAAGIFAIPQSLGGLLAAIASVATVYWQSSSLTHTVISAIACLSLYLLGFQDVGYESAPDKKLSIVEIVATVITISFAVSISLIISQTHVSLNWLTSIAIGLICGAITLVGKQLIYIDLSQKEIWRLFGIVSASSFVMGFGIRAILYALANPIIVK
ncbi:MAG: hypothetical protein DCF20_08110 [Pseudanabaena sp.]|nr:MAG: hypothetical protein DCF20_08110 [Pseudanabaena sp.]